MPVSIDGTAGIVNNATDLNYTGTLTGGTGVVNLGSGQVYKDASGNVGFGTTSPAVKFQINQDQAANSYFDYYNQTNGGGVIWRQIVRNIANTGNTSVDIAKVTGGAFLINNNDTNAANYTAFGIGGAERMRIDSAGNLLVGKTSATYTTSGVSLSNGTNQFAWSGNSGSVVASFATPVNQSQIGFYRTDTGGLMGAISNGASNTVAYGTSSDYRLKDNVKPMTGALAKVAALRPVTWTWKEDGSDGQGFIAHEINEVVPGCATGTKDAVDSEGKPQYQGIDTSFLVATLTAAIQELKAIVDTQAARITALEGKPA